MCLINTKVKCPKVYSRRSTGYKVFYKRDDIYESPVYSSFKTKKGIWRQSKNEQFPFHIFLSLNAAISYKEYGQIICRVKFDKVVYYGYQPGTYVHGEEGNNAVCAKRIKILHEVHINPILKR